MVKHTNLSIQLVCQSSNIHNYEKFNKKLYKSVVREYEPWLQYVAPMLGSLHTLLLGPHYSSV